jgi:hypothetical protein
MVIQLSYFFVRNEGADQAASFLFALSVWSSRQPSTPTFLPYTDNMRVEYLDRRVGYLIWPDWGLVTD